MPEDFFEISKEITFDAAHYLHNPSWSRKRNLEVFGKCSGFREGDPKAEAYPHGHTYRLRVTVRGPLDPATGFTVDFHVLKDLLTREVEARYDHRFLNKEVEPFRSDSRLQPTAENIVRDLWIRLESPLRKMKVVPVAMMLWESDSSFVTYRGGK